MDHPYRLGVLPGDDIGLEVVPESVKVAKAALDRVGVAVDWIDMPIGRPAYDSLGTTMPDDTLERLSALHGWILGPIGHRDYPKVPEAVNPHPILRKRFEMHSNIRPSKSLAGVKCLYEDVDLVIVRENTEGFQPDRNMIAGSGEFRPTEDITLSVRVITKRNSARVARSAFELARRRTGKVTAVHKNTVFKLGCGMFMDTVREVSADYPDVVLDECIVDTFALRAVMKPQDFDVVVTTNMFGDILSDLTAGLVGGLGLAPGLSAGDDHAMAQATHGSAPDIAGKNIANPYAMVQSAAMLLDWLGQKHSDNRMHDAADLMDRAAVGTIEIDQIRTTDLGGTASTIEMGDAMARRVASL